ncbi:DEAD/DEAH box helicase [Tessaracoccus flavus]|jgi:superfamily II DNA/RNA helicase|uniref:RNA helicase n=1 Tax=Tessaracoccus flavus TaxID=1610493 RepID=A0A1Q2CCT3_9ACTN|nr:DEAD/DEAH box helicase [Tessaracoccus flavus]AQP43933.1 RNA helicase [Tessaracoccus flavus]SDY29105.1 Superfamily II DNA and RNA helicase [Tessaracoccus flavus]
MTSSAFRALGVPTHLAAVLEARGITTPTPIQAATLPDSMSGRDVLGRGRTGSGKTYAFLLPMVARLTESGTKRAPKRPRALILAPTRELATQIDEALAPLAEAAGLTSRTIFGGVNQRPQVAALTRGVDVLVACPGRLEDLIAQGFVTLNAIEITILDEADHMADLGFLPSVRRLLGATPQTGQRMLFSATLDKAVDTLVKQFLHQPKVHEADSAESPVPTLHHHVLHVSNDAHLPVLVNLAAAPGRSVVFTRTKHRAKKLAKQLNAAGVPAVELQGNMSQGQRERSMAAFHAGTAQTLVATDVAARGIHVDDVGLVIHADPPVEHKAYTHRSGRTARAGAEGTVVTLMLDAQRSDVRDLTRKAGVKPTITRADERHPVLVEIAPGERTFPGGLVKPEPQQPTGGRRRNPAGDRSRGAEQGRGANRTEGRAQSRSERPRGAAQGDAPSGRRQGQPRSRSAQPVGTGGAAAFSASTGRGRGRR